MWVIDFGLLDSHKLSAELGNFTLPFREDMEGRGILRGLHETGKSSEKKITSVQALYERPRHEAPAVPQDVSLTLS